MKDQLNTNNSGFMMRTYKKDAPYSYTSGAFATFELLKTRPESAQAVYIHSKFSGDNELTALCRKENIPTLTGDRHFSRLNQPENIYVMGIFKKFYEPLSHEHPHMVLVNPSEFGNIGAIIRTAVAQGFADLAVILPAGDIFNPKTVRAAMGAVFHLRLQCFNNFDEYKQTYKGHHCYPFLSDGAKTLNEVKNCIYKPFSLIFGNEAAGLPASFAGIGTGVRIPQSDKVDSMNVAVAAGIGAYVFMNQD